MISSEASAGLALLTHECLPKQIAKGIDSRVIRVGGVVLKLYDQNLDRVDRDGYALSNVDVSDLQMYKELMGNASLLFSTTPRTGLMSFVTSDEGDMSTFHYDVSVIPVLAVGSFEGTPATVSEFIPGPNFAQLVGYEGFLRSDDLSDEQNDFFERNRPLMVEDNLLGLHSYPDPPENSSCIAFQVSTEIFAMNNALRKLEFNPGIGLSFVNVKLGVDLEAKRVHLMITDLYNDFRMRR